MAGMNVGTLNGSLVLDDDWTPVLQNSAQRVEQWEREVTAQFKQAQQNLNGTMGAMGKRLQDFGDDAMKVGTTLSAAITLPLVLIAKQALTTGISFESSINKINGVLSPTKDQMEQIRAKAMEMGAATVFSATESADAMLELGKAGFTTEEALAGVDEVLQLAAASGMSMADSAALSARTLNAFGLEVSDLAHVNDVLAKAVNTTSLEIDDLRLGFQYVGPIAKALGISLEEATSALGIMRDAGISAETSGRALREGLNRLANPVKSVTDVMKELGINSFTTAGHLNSLPSIIETLQNRGITAEQALKLFGNAAGPGMFALVQKGKDGLVELTKGLENSEGAAKHMADAMMEGLPGAMEKLRGSVETAWLAISKAIEPSAVKIMGLLEGVADFITETLVPAFQSMPSWAQTAALGIAALAAATGPLILGLGATAKALGVLMESKLILGALNMMQDAFFAVARSIGAVTVAAETSTAALIAMRAAMAGIVGIGIAAVLIGAKVAFDRLNEGLEKQKKEWKDNEEASKLAGRAITDHAEALTILDAKVRGASGAQLEGKRITIDQVKVWNEARAGAGGLKTELSGLVINLDSLNNKQETTVKKTKELTDEEKKAIKVINDRDTAIRALTNEAQLKWMNAMAESMAKEKQWQEVLEDSKIAVENLAFAEQARFENLSNYNFSKMPGNNILQFMRPEQLQNKPFDDPDIWGDMQESLQKQLAGIPMTLARAFEGGGDIMGAVKSIASQIGSTIGGSVGEFFGGPIGGILGSAVGSLAGPLVGLFTRGSAEAKKLRGELQDLHAEFLKNHAALKDISGTAKMLGVDFDWTSSTKKNIEELKREIEIFDQRLKALQETGNEALQGFITYSQFMLKSMRETVTITNELTGATKQVEINSVGAATQLEAIGDAALAAFSAAVASGMNAREALELIAPTLSTLRDRYAELGIKIDDAALSGLMMQSSMLEKSPELLAAVDGLASSFAALNTLGLLNESTFRAMQTTGSQMYTQLQAAAAATGGTTKDALLPMQGYLHAAEQAAKDLGIPLDDNTAMLIEQSKELGIWKEQGKTANEVLLGAVLDLKSAMQDVATTIRDIVSGLLGIPRNVTSEVRVHTTYTESREGGEDPSRASGSPSTTYENWEGGTDVRLHGQEAIVSKSQGSSLAGMVGDAITRASDSSSAQIDYSRAIMESNNRVVAAIQDLGDTLPIFMRDAMRGAA